MNYKTDYDILCAQVSALIRGVPHRIANLANVSAAVYQAMEGLNWVGFYLWEGDRLVLGPFQGKTACIEIPLGRGVCGTAAKEGRTLVVPDVHQFPGHIACDCASNSEIVIPIYENGNLYGVLDIDSPHLDRFSESDKAGLEKLVRILEKEM